VLSAIKQLARQSHLPRRDLDLVSRAQTYAHVDPLAASPGKNAFLHTVVPFLQHLP
jgi:hypothetical protein